MRGSLSVSIVIFLSVSWPSIHSFTITTHHGNWSNSRRERSVRCLKVPAQLSILILVCRHQPRSHSGRWTGRWVRQQGRAMRASEHLDSHQRTVAWLCNVTRSWPLSLLCIPKVTSDDTLQVKVEPEEGTTSITGERQDALVTHQDAN